MNEAHIRFRQAAGYLAAWDTGGKFRQLDNIYFDAFIMNTNAREASMAKKSESTRMPLNSSTPTAPCFATGIFEADPDGFYRARESLTFLGSQFSSCELVVVPCPSVP
jgi:hypothetical protein